MAYQVKSQVAAREGRFDDAVEAAEQALAFDPNDADSYVALAEALIYGGRADEALDRIDDARRHDPHSEARYAFLEGLAQFSLDQFEAAAESFERTLELNPELWNPEAELGKAYCYPCVVLISAYGHLGRTAEARPMIEKVLAFWTGFRAWSEVLYWSFRGDKDVARFTDGLVKAGVPE